MARKIRKIWMWIIPAAVLAAGVFYYFVNPSESSVAPKCPMKLLTGWQCPSCGGQRALHAFLHGRLAEAVSYNLFFIIAIPFLLVTAYATLMINRPNPSRLTISLYNFATSKYTLMSYIAVYLVWWVVRNLLGI
ncbi:MAG: DUF2752 domain-containing protein [Bacteroidales bacterium]|nr:DUF2752 domain-containing protein [Bacteroidales bacterium]